MDELVVELLSEAGPCGGSRLAPGVSSAIRASISISRARFRSRGLLLWSWAKPVCRPQRALSRALADFRGIAALREKRKKKKMSCGRAHVDQRDRVRRPLPIASRGLPTLIIGFAWRKARFLKRVLQPWEFGPLCYCRHRARSFVHSLARDRYRGPKCCVIFRRFPCHQHRGGLRTNPEKRGG